LNARARFAPGSAPVDVGYGLFAAAPRARGGEKTKAAAEKHQRTKTRKRYAHVALRSKNQFTPTHFAGHGFDHPIANEHRAV
jgi:hypothetical protein